MNITVVALGKIGLPLAAFYAARGHLVTGCDINPAIVDAVNRGDSPIRHEPGLSDQLREAVAAGRLRATTDTTAGVREADVVIVVAPLVLDEDNQPDYGPLDTAFRAISAGVSPDALVILETTVAVGDTRQRFSPILEVEHGPALAFSPERVQSGTLVRDLTTYPRVVGGVTVAAGERAAAFYQENLGVEVLVLPNSESAEFCKLAESIYRDVNIALANEFARYAEQTGVDLSAILTAANSQPQSHIHQPGVGVGGHCIPVYPYLLTTRTADSRLAALARAVNDDMPDYAVARLARELGSLTGRTVLVLGVAFRPGVKEAAHSPAFALVEALRQRGAQPLVHDPMFTKEELAALGLPAVTLDALPLVDAAIIQTAHQHYRHLEYRSLPGLRVVLDGRACLDPAALERLGIRYLAIGRGETTGGLGGESSHK